MVLFWIAFTGCFLFVSPQLPPGFNLPALMRVDRNWIVMSGYPVGTLVTTVHRDKTGDQPVTFGLETSGPPVPFKIDPRTGVVTVNETLVDKVNRSYSLWVTAYDGSIPQRAEVLATITDNTGYRPKISIPPNFLPKYPGQPTANNPFIPKTTKATDLPYQVQTEEAKTKEIETTTIVNGPKKPEYIPQQENRTKTEVQKNNSSVTPVANEVSLEVIPLVAICGLVVIVAGVLFFVFWKRNHGLPTKPSKSDKDKDPGGIVLRDASFNLWSQPRALSNRYESWDNQHLQISEETSITKEEPIDEWEFPRHRIKIFNIVGEGAFGQVWRAQAIDIDGQKGEQTVAVKTLKENASEKEKIDLLQELLVMKNLGHHPNVVRLIGCCTEKEPTFVIMEFVSLGKLQQYLRDSRAERHYGNTHAGSQFLTSRDLTHFAYQVARGMDFLSDKGIIHRDLAARNVLITEDRTCKVADFGFARDVAGTHVYERKSDGRLPIRWMAPESLYDDIFSVKSDIWSFGVLLWEIVTLGSTPYPGLSAGDVMRKVRDGYRLEKPEHCRRELYNIMYYCWEAEPTARPDFKDVVSMLERLICTETDYIELERFPDHSYYNVQHLDGEKL